ncbi:molybdopterin converting factor subunit 1 [Sphingomonas elodea]|uniref:molybdopterin converting factor subunit 1 n=1 Tax=Sphingomonas elodea TaxID=179878 RepID=UPI0002631349|nr:molybdopterin converting factor subunit 1 [Sphingomonas elodea]
MGLTMLYFAWVRERVGAGEERVDPPEGVQTVAGLIEWLSARSDGHAAAFAAPSRLRAAIDQRFVPLDAALNGAREVAIFPPVTGG